MSAPAVDDRVPSPVETRLTAGPAEADSVGVPAEAGLVMTLGGTARPRVASGPTGRRVRNPTGLFGVAAVCRQVSRGGRLPRRVALQQLSSRVASRPGHLGRPVRRRFPRRSRRYSPQTRRSLRSSDRGSCVALTDVSVCSTGRRSDRPVAPSRPHCSSSPAVSSTGLPVAFSRRFRVSSRACSTAARTSSSMSSPNGGSTISGRSLSPLDNSV